MLHSKQTILTTIFLSNKEKPLAIW